MTQTEIIDKLNSIYPGLDLVEVTDPYNSYDAENERYIVEVKSRDKKYRGWAIERKKFDSNNKDPTLIKKILNKLFTHTLTTKFPKTIAAFIYFFEIDQSYQ